MTDTRDTPEDEPYDATPCAVCGVPKDVGVHNSAEKCAEGMATLGRQCVDPKEHHPFAPAKEAKR